MADVDGNGVIRADGLFVPNFLIDLIDRENLARILDEQQEDIVLNRCEFDGIAADLNFLGLIVDYQIADRVEVLIVAAVHVAELRIAAKLALDARHEFQGIEGLGEIVVRTDIQAQNLVIVFGFGRENNNRDGTFFSDLSGGPDAVESGHHDIDNQKIHGGVFHNFQRLRTVIGGQNLETFAGEVDADCLDDFVVIVTNQNSLHMLSSLC